MKKDYYKIVFFKGKKLIGFDRFYIEDITNILRKIDGKKIIYEKESIKTKIEFKISENC